MRPIWDNRRKEIEQFLAEGKTSTEIAAHYETTRALVQKNCSRWKLPIPRIEGSPGSKSNDYRVNHANRNKPQVDPFGACRRE